MEASELIAISEKEGCKGVVARIFIYLHKGAFRTMSGSELRDFLSEIESDENSKNAFICFKAVIELEEKYRAETGVCI